jgi:hypothetical protein
MVSSPMSVRVHFITAFFYFPCVNNRCCFLCGSRHTRQYLCMERHSCLMWTNTLYDDTSSLYDDNFPLYDDTFSLYDDTSLIFVNSWIQLLLGGWYPRGQNDHHLHRPTGSKKSLKIPINRKLKDRKRK